MCVSVCVCVYACMRVCVCMCVCVFVCACMRVYNTCIVCGWAPAYARIAMVSKRCSRGSLSHVCRYTNLINSMRLVKLLS